MPSPYSLTHDEHAKRLFAAGSKYLAPSDDDLSMLTGYLLFSIALEKLIKHALSLRSELLCLQKITSDDVIAGLSGPLVPGKPTVSLPVAFSRLAQVIKSLAPYEPQVSKISKDRNLLAHREGIVSMATFERRARIDVVDVLEAVCNEALSTTPDNQIGTDLWQDLLKYRKAYSDAEALKLEERMAFLKRLYAQGEPLPCSSYDRSSAAEVLELDCPVCEDVGELDVEIGEDVSFDGGEAYVTASYPIGAGFECRNCGFTLGDADEVEAAFGSEFLREMLYPEPDY
ncbi:hypothetical protein ACFL6U_02955 [Planctomycetota bacterium]